MGKKEETCEKAPPAEHFALHRTLSARVVEWQTRTFEGRMPKGMRVQVPPRARFFWKQFDQRLVQYYQSPPHFLREK